MDMIQSQNSPKKNIKLIIIEKNSGKLNYHQKCEIIIDKVAEKIIITPKETAAGNIEKSFDETFGCQNEFLYSFSPKRTFILIFSRKESCKMVYDFVFKKSTNATQNLFNDEILLKQFILPFFKSFQSNNPMEGILKDILAQMLHSFTIKQKESCLNELQKNNINKNLIKKYFEDSVTANNKKNNGLQSECIMVNDDDDSDNYSDNKSECESEEESENDKSRSKSRRKIIEYSEIVESPNFKIVECEKRNRKRPKLIIFPFKNDKTKCYEYYWYNKKQLYLCCGCANERKQIRAKIIQKNGNEFAQLQSEKHVCKIREYNSEKYDFDPLSLILDETRFVKFEYEKDGKRRKVLVIFDLTDKNLCYEYFWRSKIERYECSGCGLKFKQNCAKLFEKNGKEFVQISTRKHICELRKFNPKKFENIQILEATNFEIVEYDRRGVTREKLILFPINGDRRQCYEYFWNESTKRFICLGCSNKGKPSFAKICEKNGRKVVEIAAATKHICEIREYNPKNYDLKIVKAPDFKIIKTDDEEFTTKSPILFIFCPTNKKLGYEYSWDPRCLCYICLGCHGFKQRTTATVRRGLNGEEEFVKLSKTLHICNLREFDPEKFKPNIIIKKSDFIMHEQNICGSIKKKLFVFTSKDRKMGYKFAYYEGYHNVSYFYCIKCKNQNHSIPAKIYTDKNGNEYLSMRDKKHICEPIEYVIDEYESRKIVKAPRYQLIQRNIRNRMLERLIVFTDDEKSLCYEYTKGPKSYVCNICGYNYKHNVFAKLIKDKNGAEEEYVELGPNEHKCSPIKFEPPEALIVNLPNFKIETFTKNGVQRKSLIIFSSKNKKLKYNYFFAAKTKSFVCGKCSKKNKRITAKLLKNENGEDYLELNSKNHLCKPR